MALTEIEFELSAQQYEMMGYPGLSQGQPLSVVLDAGVLLPDPNADHWFTVQPAPLPPQFCQVGRGVYAFTGQIIEADLFKADGAETGVVVVNCGVAPVRVTCAPQEDGVLPWGTWETRTLTGIGRIQGVVEEDYQAGVGKPIGVTVWSFRRLVLTPGDPLFGQWHATTTLLPQPYQYYRVFVTARVHRNGM